MESEERGAPGPLYLRALGFSTARAQLPQKPHKTRTGGFALRAKKEFTQSSRTALFIYYHLSHQTMKMTVVASVLVRATEGT